MSQPSHGRVFVLGSLNTDLFARVEHHPAPGETIIGAGGETRPGGKGANQALAAALCGAPTHMIGAVGNDTHAATATHLLQQAGVNLAAVRVSDAPTGLAMITVSADGENSIIVIPGANADLGDEDLAHLEDIGPGDVLVLQAEVPVDVCAQAAQRAHEHGARVVINLAPAVDYPAQALRLADPLVVNEHEGQQALTLLGADEHDDPHALVDALHRAGVSSVVMTLGGAGSLVADDTLTTIEAVHRTAVDTTGAGDAYVGAMAARLSQGDDLRTACRFASSYAAEAVMAPGAQDSYPDWRKR